MSYFAGQTTPIYFTFSGFDPSSADDFIITFSYAGNPILEFDKTDAVYTSSTVMIELTQTQSLSLPIGPVKVQFNFLKNGVRIPTEIVTLNIDKNLHMSVIS